MTRRRLWPFLGVVDTDGQAIGWCGLSGPLRKQSDLDAYRELRRSLRFVGFTSHMTFPMLNEGLIADYERLCDGWCHCFRRPEDYISPELPKALISESDFTDFHSVSPQAICGWDSAGKEFDFIYVCLPGRWTEMTKNWTLAKACLHRLCFDLNLKGLLLGRWQILDLPFRRNLTVVGDVPRRKLLEYIAHCGLVFVPSLMDASPRLLAEALCMNVPILVNRQVLGGWKYVNDATGAFFSDENDVVRAAEHCLEGRCEPRDWFRANHGPRTSSLKLSAFLHGLDARLQPTTRLRLASQAEAATVRATPAVCQSRRGMDQPVWLRPPSPLASSVSSRAVEPSSPSHRSPRF